MSTPKILLIDDEDSVRQMLAEFLNLKGYQTFEANGGAKGLQIAELIKPEIIILDLKMPEMDGIEVLKKIRAKDISTTVLMLTGVYDETAARMAIQQGAYDYLTKPIDLTSLESLIARILPS